MKFKRAIYVDGLMAGVIGAAVIAIWFLFLDVVRGLPFYAPTVLGTGFFQGADGLARVDSSVHRSDSPSREDVTFRLPLGTVQAI